MHLLIANRIITILLFSVTAGLAIQSHGIPEKPDFPESIPFPYNQIQLKPEPSSTPKEPLGEEGRFKEAGDEYKILARSILNLLEMPDPVENMIYPVSINSSYRPYVRIRKIQNSGDRQKMYGTFVGEFYSYLNITRIEDEIYGEISIPGRPHLIVQGKYPEAIKVRMLLDKIWECKSE